MVPLVGPAGSPLVSREKQGYIFTLMGEVIAINQKRFFTLEEAREHLPLIRRVTKAIYGEVKRLNTQISFTREAPKRAVLEQRVQSLFQEWNDKIRKLGCEAKGSWLVDFDSGDGYYCWHFPEPDINYYHGYFEGFRSRVKLH